MMKNVIFNKGKCKNTKNVYKIFLINDLNVHVLDDNHNNLSIVKSI